MDAYKALESLSTAAALFAVVFVMTALGLAFVRRLRGGAADDRSNSSEMMSNFRELHAQGGLSDEEFRNIKTKLAAELKSELEGDGGAG